MGNNLVGLRMTMEDPGLISWKGDGTTLPRSRNQSPRLPPHTQRFEVVDGDRTVKQLQCHN